MVISSYSPSDVDSLRRKIPAANVDDKIQKPRAAMPDLTMQFCFLRRKQIQSLQKLLSSEPIN